MLVPISMDTNMAAGNRKKTSGVHFCQKRSLFSLVNIRRFRQMFLLIFTLFRMLKISGRVILKIRNSSATAVLLMSRTMKIRKLKLFYFQKNTRYRAKELWRDRFLGNLSLKEGKNSVLRPPSFDFRILVTSRDNQELLLVTSGYYLYQNGGWLISRFSRSSKMAAMSNSPGQRLKVDFHCRVFVYAR